MTGIPRWTSRLRVTSNLVHAGAFVVAFVGTIAGDGLTTSTAIAILAAALGVLLAAFVDIPFTDGRVVERIFLIAGVVLFTFSISLTGGLNSAFVIMPIASIFLAAMAGGVSAAAPTALLAVGGVLITTWLGDQPIDTAAIIRVPAIYAITAIAFSEVQRALARESERVRDLEIATTAALGRTERLEETHTLLEDLLKIATSPDMNAVATSQDALRDVGVIAPAAPGRIVALGNINLARRGTPPPIEPTNVFPVERSGVELARLELWLEDPDITPSVRNAIGASVAPVGIALENDAMVQQLAGITIQRERVRLARELHDDIAPSIASVGLALDMVLMGEELAEDQERTLEATRTNITILVERIRARVQDLRADRTVSIVEMAHSLVAEVDADGPTVIVDIDERTPPRPAIALELGAVVTEAFRNSLRHANATVITIGGRIDERSGEITISDNGQGFDVDGEATGRFGLVGMTERAHLIGAHLDLASSPGDGTVVSVTWEDAK